MLANLLNVSFIDVISVITGKRYHRAQLIFFKCGTCCGNNTYTGVKLTENYKLSVVYLAIHYLINYTNESNQFICKTLFLFQIIVHI